jgi:ABC-type lipoprotein export system ATPase subunit
VNVTKEFRIDGTTTIAPLREINLEVHRGEFLMVVGRSGSGKTTLLNLCAGLIKPTSGTVKFSGLDISSMDDIQLSQLRRHKIGFVFQFQSMLPNLTVLENVALPASVINNRRNAFKRASELLEIVGLGERGRAYPRQLSAGELRRVTISRALINRPEILLADEPTADLDEKTELTIVSLLRQIHLTGITVVMITHNTELIPYSTRALRVDKGLLLTSETTNCELKDTISSIEKSTENQVAYHKIAPLDSTDPDNTAIGQRSGRNIVKTSYTAGITLALLAMLTIWMFTRNAVFPVTIPDPLQLDPQSTTLVSPPGNSPVKESITTNKLLTMQQYEVASASFNALMIFSFNGSDIEFPANLQVPLVPILWSGTSFSGNRKQASPGLDVTYTMNGVVSGDGSSLESLVYTTSLVRGDVNNGIFYSVALADIPLGNIVRDAYQGVGTYQETGPDLLKKVFRVEYIDGQVTRGLVTDTQITPLTTYKATAWNSRSPIPTLKITFGKTGVAKDEISGH